MIFRFDVTITSGGNFLSPVKGLPGAKRIIKNEIVIRIKSVGIASKKRRKINLSIARSYNTNLFRRGDKKTSLNLSKVSPDYLAIIYKSLVCKLSSGSLPE